MEIKGTAVKTIPQFVKSVYPTRYEQWLESLPPQSKSIIDAPIYATQWYPLREAAIIPTRSLGMFYNGDSVKGALESGKFSAKEALTGVYNVFIKLSSPVYIINRAGKIFSTYYNPSNIQVVSRKVKSVTLHITHFPMPDKIIEYRITGWMMKALEMNGCKNVVQNIPLSLAEGDKCTEITLSWD